MIFLSSTWLPTVQVATCGCQALKVELFSEDGHRAALLEISLDQALAIAKHLESHKFPTDSSQSGWELK